MRREERSVNEEGLETNVRYGKQVEEVRMRREERSVNEEGLETNVRYGK